MAGFFDAISDAVETVVESIAIAPPPENWSFVEAVIKRETGKDIEVTTKDIPTDWDPWIKKTGMNSLCCSWTWRFLENSQCNQRKLELWKKRDIKKIIVTVDAHPDEELSRWAEAVVNYEKDSSELTVVWLPRAKRWSSDYAWNESGYKRYWCLRDEIVFGLQLYQLPGKCFYKSDYLEGFEDPDPDNPLPTATKKFKRWFQFRHWCIFWFAEAMPGWNYQWTTSPPPSSDGEPFSLSNILSLPSMPDIKRPQIKLPNLPDIRLPDVSMPTMEVPSAPSLSTPEVSRPEAPKRPKGKWSCHGVIEMERMLVCTKGETLVLSDLTITHFWQDGDGRGVRNEKKEHQKLELECPSEEQAESWKLSLMASGAEEGETGCCCLL